MTPLSCNESADIKASTKTNKKIPWNFETKKSCSKSSSGCNRY